VTALKRAGTAMTPAGKAELDMRRLTSSSRDFLPFTKPVAGVMTVVPANEEARAERRHKVFHTGTCTCLGVTFPIHVLNISSIGALAHADDPPKIGDCVSIKCGIPLGRANISWVEGERFGLRFVIPLSDVTLRQTAGIGPPRSIARRGGDRKPSRMPLTASCK
jgi:hypothetical protein